MVMNMLIIIFLNLYIGLFLHINGPNSNDIPQSLYKAKGKASYYSDKFNKRRTSSGEIFYNDSLTAAHKTLAFGTIVKVTNLLNDSVVIVRINDRLPKKSSRIIDLSKAAARKLNFISQGLTKVSIEQLAK
jgi:rare lipoprotein A